jgi:multiple sugar transport system substrate-binding protein
MRRAAATAILAAVVLTACGGSAADDRTTLRLLLFGGPEEIAGYEAMAAEFEDANADLDVVVSPVANQDDLLGRLATGFASSAPPEVFLINFRKYGQFAARGALRPVQDYLDDSTVLSEDDFVATALDVFRFDDGDLTCLPQNVSSLVVYYNLDLVDARGVPHPSAGWTWDDFLTAAQGLTGDGTYGVGISPDLIRLAPFVWSNGGEVVDDEVAPTRLTLDTGAAREALDFFLDLSLVHGVVPADAEELSEDAESRFLRGGLGMYLSSRRSVPTLRTIDKFTWDAAPLPVAPGGTPVTMLHSDAYCISDGTGREDAAWRLIEFAMGDRGQEILAESGRTVPSRIAVLESDAFLEPTAPPRSAQVFVDNARIARATPHTASWAQVERQANDILESMFYGRIGREEGLRQLTDDLLPVFREGS